MTTLAIKIAVAIKRVDPKHTHSIEIMQYSLSIILNTLFVIAVSLSTGWITGYFQYTAIALSSLSILRFTSGGIHLNSAWGCNIISILILTVIPHIPIHSIFVLNLLNFFNLIIMALFAPSPDKNTQIPVKLIPLLKLFSVLLVSSNFFIGSNVIGLAFFIQSLTVIPMGRRVLK